MFTHDLAMMPVAMPMLNIMNISSLKTVLKPPTQIYLSYWMILYFFLVNNVNLNLAMPMKVS